MKELKRVRFHESNRPAIGLRMHAAVVLSALMALVSADAAAYVGPGAGLTMLGSGLALVLVILVALAGLVIWPLRALRRRKKEK